MRGMELVNIYELNLPAYSNNKSKLVLVCVKFFLFMDPYSPQENTIVELVGRTQDTRGSDK